MTFKIWKKNTNSAIQMRFHFKCDHCNCVLLFLPSFNKCSTWFILPAVVPDKTRFELNALRVIALQFAVKTFPSYVCMQTRLYCGFINILGASNFIDFWENQFQGLVFILNWKLVFHEYIASQETLHCRSHFPYLLGTM